MEIEKVRNWRKLLFLHLFLMFLSPINFVLVKMSTQISKLEKENAELKVKCDETDVSLISLLDEVVLEK